MGYILITTERSKRMHIHILKICKYKQQNLTYKFYARLVLLLQLTLFGSMNSFYLVSKTIPALWYKWIFLSLFSYLRKLSLCQGASPKEIDLMVRFYSFKITSPLLQISSFWKRNLEWFPYPWNLHSCYYVPIPSLDACYPAILQTHKHHR